VEFWKRLEDVHRRWNVLEHPFYQRWSEGRLTREELALYAGEYRHAVVALADASARAAAAAGPQEHAELERHAAEEAGHVGLWDAFAREIDADLERAPAPETVVCAETWAGAEDGDLLPTLVRLYAIESAQPAIAQTKLSGLRAHYGLDGEAETAYFSLHAELDHEHAAQERALIEPRLEGADHDALAEEAEAALRANWTLLDGVERVCGR
jgi:pyrroloquinoline-quinone synthase